MERGKQTKYLKQVRGSVTLTKTLHFYLKENLDDFH
jgi:hypothetical protein